MDRQHVLGLEKISVNAWFYLQKMLYDDWALRYAPINLILISWFEVEEKIDVLVTNHPFIKQ